MPYDQFNPLDGDSTLATRGSVLIIDDDAATLGVLKDLLSINGFSVLTAGEGGEGIEIFKQRSPDLVVTDIHMPQIDGLEVLGIIREMDGTVPVVVVTGHGDLENAVRALRRGAHDFLLKPVNAEILSNTVQKGIEHCRLRRFERDYRNLLEEEVEKRTTELGRTNEFLKGILDSSTGVSIVLTDFDHNVLFWNTGAQNIFGYAAEEMIGSSVFKLCGTDNVGMEAIESLQRIMQIKAGTVQGKIKHVSKDGQALTISMAVSPMLDASGNIRGILGLGQDVTEEVRLHDELVKSYQRIRRLQGASIFALAKLAESRDGETAFHLSRLQAYCRILCDQISARTRYKEFMTQQFTEDLVQCSVLHDIGKVGIPDSILFNSKKFGIDEFEVMKRHSVYGGAALEEAAHEAGDKESYLFLAKDVAYYHHERWDGSGYPFGLKGEEIPLSARIVAVADVYDALTTERRYKRSYSHEEALDLIVQEKSKQFDPELVETFLEVETQFKAIRDKIPRGNRHPQSR
ncbi:MAG: response regulator [Desulfomonilaceae bacterium]